MTPHGYEAGLSGGAGTGRPPSKMQPTAEGVGGGGGSSFGKRSGAADAATTGLPITHYLYIEISHPLPTPWEKPLRRMELRPLTQVVAGGQADRTPQVKLSRPKVS